MRIAVAAVLVLASCTTYGSGSRWQSSRGKLIELPCSGQFSISTEMGMPRIVEQSQSITRVVIEPDPTVDRSWLNNQTFQFSAHAAERLVVSADRELTWRYRTEGRWLQNLHISVEE